MKITLLFVAVVINLVFIDYLKSVQGATKKASCLTGERKDGRNGWPNEKVCNKEAANKDPKSCKCVASQCYRKPPKVACPVATKTDHCKRRVCYWPNWAQYKDSRWGKAFKDDGESPDLPHYSHDIPACLCTHIVYAFLGIKDGVIGNKEWNDLPQDYTPGQLHCFKKYVKEKTTAKALIALGGWTEKNYRFHNIVKTPESRKKFIDSVTAFLRKHEFDGIDFDWEYPDLRCSTTGEGENPDSLKEGDCSLAGDKQNFVKLLKETMEAFIAEATDSQKARLLVTAAVGCGKDVIPVAYDVPGMQKHLDFISLMSYDLKGAFDKKTGHQAPLFGDFDGDTKSVSWCAKEFHRLGAPKEKLNVGIPFYGRSFTIDKKTAETEGTGLNVTATAGEKQPYSEEAGSLFFYEACELIAKDSGRETWMEKQQVPYFTTKKSNGTVYWAGYDNVRSVKNKAWWVRNESYGGVMMWDISQDDFLGVFCQQEKAYPLLHAVNDVCFADTYGSPNGDGKDNTKTKDDLDADHKSSSFICTAFDSLLMHYLLVFVWGLALF